MIIFVRYLLGMGGDVSSELFPQALVIKFQIPLFQITFLLYYISYSPTVGTTKYPCSER